MAWVTLVLLPVAGGCGSSSEHEVRVVPDEEIQILGAGAAFADVLDVARDGAHVWALDTEPPFFARVNLETGEMLRFGDEGAGPSEMVWPVAIVPNRKGDELVIWDPGARRVHRFGAGGRHLESTRLDRGWGATTRRDVRHVTYGDPFRVRRDRDGFVTAIYPSGVNRNRDVNLGSIAYAPDMELEQLSTLGPLSQFSVQDGDALRELGPLPLWDHCDGRLVVWNPAERAVQWFEGPLTDGARFSVAMSGTRRLLSRAAKLEHLAAMARLELGPAYERQDVDLEKRLAELDGAFATWAPEVVDIRCGGSRAVWLRLRQDSRRSDVPERWRRVEPSGASSEVWFPDFFRPFAFGETRVVGVVQRPEGDALGIWTRDALVEPRQASTSP